MTGFNFLPSPAAARNEMTVPSGDDTRREKPAETDMSAIAAIVMKALRPFPEAFVAMRDALRAAVDAGISPEFEPCPT